MKHCDASIRIVQIVPALMRIFNATLRTESPSLSPGHFRVLSTLAFGQRNLSELAYIEHVSLPTMSNTVSTLVNRGWLERVRDTDDRRRVRIELTDEGEEALKRLQRLAQDRIDKLIEPLSDAECENVWSALNSLDACLAGECDLLDTFQAPLDDLEASA